LPPSQAYQGAKIAAEKVAFFMRGTVEAGLRFWPFAGKSDIRAAEDQR
jgi:hypothetical protein